MWKYTATNAYPSISLHDCRSNDIQIDGRDLIINFPDGFWITPVSSYIDHDRPLKTGPAQLCIRGFLENFEFDSIDVYKTTHIFGKPVLCRRLQPEDSAFLKLFQKGKYELEFITEYHKGYMPILSLYQCMIWYKKFRKWYECQFEMTAESMEYRWNEILQDREW